MKELTKEEALAKWIAWRNQDVTIESGTENSIIDPYYEEDWHSMALGFYSALGFDAQTCRELAQISPL